MPALWGTEPHRVELFGRRAAAIRCHRTTLVFRCRSAEHWLEVFHVHDGPTLKAFAALDEAGQQRLAADIVALLRRLNTAGSGSLVVPGETLEMVVVKP